MTKKRTKFSQEAQKICMTARERELLRSRIVSYMEYHPLRSRPVAGRAAVSARAFRTVQSFFAAQSMRSRSLVGALVVVLLAGVPVAAEQAVPGDVLYPVKVRFNEGIRAQLAFSPYEKVAWETRRVERRIDEARRLAEEGRLTEEYEITLEQNVRKHTEAVQDQLAVIRKNDTEGAAIAEVTLESTYDVQSAMLETHASSSEAADVEAVEGLAAIVRAARNEVSASSAATSTSSYDLLVARIETNLTRIDALSESLADGLSDTQRADIAERTQEVMKDLDDVRAARQRGGSDVPVAVLRDALSTTQKILAFMSNINIRSRLTLDTLIPRKASDEVRLAGLSAAYDLLVAEHETLAEQAKRIKDEDEQRPAVKQVASLEALIEDMEASLDEGDLDTAQETLAKADALSESLARAFALEIETEDVVIPDTSSTTATTTTSSTSPARE